MSMRGGRQEKGKEEKKNKKTRAKLVNGERESMARHRMRQGRRVKTSGVVRHCYHFINFSLAYMI